MFDYIVGNDVKSTVPGYNPIGRWVHLRSQGSDDYYTLPFGDPHEEEALLDFDVEARAHGSSTR
jgi:hypothetical protein